MYHRRFVAASRRVLGRITTTTTTTKKKQDRPSLSYFQLQSVSTISSTAAPTTEATKATEAAKLIQTFQSIVASSTIRGINIFSAVQEQNVLNGRVENSTTAAYLKGQRLGSGTALAIVRPTTLAQVPQIVQAAIEANCTIIVQGANTGLTGSSVPNETEKDDRPTVIISMKHLTCIQPVDDGTKVLCYAGVGLGSLQSYVETNCGTGRMSHSVLGSTFLNPTTAAGVAFGSGGTQIRKGPSTTERALYLKVADDGSGWPIVKLVNTLGIQQLDANEGESSYYNNKSKDTTPATATASTTTTTTNTTKKQFGDGGTVLDKLDAMIARRNIMHMNLQSNTTYGTSPAHDYDYSKSLCAFNDEVTRYNADTKGLDCNRSEGKVLILATVHDTFPKPSASKSYWLSFEDLETAIQFKEHVALTDPNQLPESIEYMNRDAFKVIDRAGRFMGHFIKYFGTTSPLVRQGWDIKVQIEALPGMGKIPDQIQYLINNLLPPVVPKSVMELSKKYDHHILITVGNYDDDEDDDGSVGGGSGTDAVKSFEDRLEKFRNNEKNNNDKMMDVQELTSQSMKDGVNAFRYIAAGAFETYCVGTNLQGISVDYGLPKNRSAAPILTSLDDNDNNNNKGKENEKEEEGNGLSSQQQQPIVRMRYSHFGCNVVHEDLAYEQGVDTHRAKMALKKIVDEECGGRLPSEHGHGIEYVAPLPTKLRWMKMDPFNVMNPGVGGLSKQYKYGRDGESLWKEEEPHTGTRGTRPDRT